MDVNDGQSRGLNIGLPMKGSINLSSVQGFGRNCDASDICNTTSYFNSLKDSDNGWQLCLSTLMQEPLLADHNTKFFCLQVVEHYLKSSYQTSCDAEKQYVRCGMQAVLRSMVTGYTNKESAFVKNKMAQLFALVCSHDYPQSWPGFFLDLLESLKQVQTTEMIDLYLRILLAVDELIVDRENAFLTNMVERSTLIKDSMRGQCVCELVESWYKICSSYPCDGGGGVDEPLLSVTCMCWQVVGRYSAWIDISYIANDRFVSLIMRHLQAKGSHHTLKESCCECVSSIVHKGMEPIPKTKLVHSFYTVLHSANIFNRLLSDSVNGSYHWNGHGQCVNGEHAAGSAGDDDIDYVIKLSELVNSFGTELVQAWHRLVRSKDHVGSSSTLQVIELLVPVMLRCLCDEDDDVSKAVTDFSSQYIVILKQVSLLTDQQRSNIKAMITHVINKFKYDPDFNFTKEGEDEADFLVYRHDLKTVFNNLVLLASGQVLDVLCEGSEKVFADVKGASDLSSEEKVSRYFRDLEVHLFLLHHIGEVLPIMSGSKEMVDHAAKFMKLVDSMFSSRVFEFDHPAVSELVLEICVRYEKFFQSAPSHYLLWAVGAFLGGTGLRSSSPRLASRSAYLLCRFVKGAARPLLQAYTEEVVARLQQLLVPGRAGPHLTTDDLLSLYEAAGTLIVASSWDAQKKLLLMTSLLQPVVTRFQEVVLLLTEDECDEKTRQKHVKTLNKLMSFASYSSKAFTSEQTMRACGCTQLYCDLLQLFLSPSHSPVSAQLQPGLRQYLHRMVVCLDGELLPYLPMAVEHLLKVGCVDARGMQEVIPLINQVIAKYKKAVVPFLERVFVYVIEAIFSILSEACDASDQQLALERQALHRTYYNFISTILQYDVAEVISNQDLERMKQVLLSVVQGATDYPNPVAQKACFNIMSRMVAVWGASSEADGFISFVYKQVVPACFLAPMQASFNLQDGQTVLVLNESAACMKKIYEQRGEECVGYLQTQYLPSLNLPPLSIQEYCAALRSDKKIFQKFLKTFFTNLKLSSTTAAATGQS